MVKNLDPHKVRAYLIQLAMEGRISGYKELAVSLGAVYKNGHNHPKVIGDLVGEIAKKEHRENHPLISVLVHDLGKRRPGNGFFGLAESLGYFTPSQDEAENEAKKKVYAKEEMERCYNFWQGRFDEYDLQVSKLSNELYDNAATPKERRAIVRQYERGSIGEKVKLINGYKCQLCEILGLNSIGFIKKNSSISYIEAHHVKPVSTRSKGVLSARNIITLCANHHRQMHFGEVEIIGDMEDAFVFKIDGKLIKLARLESTKRVDSSI